MSMLQVPDWMALARPAYRTIEIVVGDWGQGRQRGGLVL